MASGLGLTSVGNQRECKVLFFFQLTTHLVRRKRRMKKREECVGEREKRGRVGEREKRGRMGEREKKGRVGEREKRGRVGETDIRGFREKERPIIVDWKDREGRRTLMNVRSAAQLFDEVTADTPDSEMPVAWQTVWVSSRAQPLAP